MTKAIKATPQALRDQADEIEQDSWARQALLEGKTDLDPASAGGVDLARRLALVLRSTAREIENAPR